MKYHKLIMFCCMGMAAGLFGRGIWDLDATRLSIAFIYLALAWAYREMYLGWDVEKKSWKLVDRPASPVASPE